MEVILDELTPLEFFNHGGIVKVTVTDENLMKECNLKKKYTFFEYKTYIKFFKDLYMLYLHNHSDKSSFELYKYVNGCITLNPTIGKSIYVVDPEYDHVKSYELTRFYYSGDKTKCEIESRDPYGIKNVNFTLINEDDDRWEEFKQQRLERGFDESELWSLDGTFARFIYPRLKAFSVTADDCHPAGMTKEEWKEVLGKMVKGFELLASDEIKTDEETQMETTALDLFADYFDALWV